MAIPLLPEPVIEDTYDDLLSTISTELKNKLADLLEYFQEQWFTKVQISQWCVHGLNMRTNNNAEGKYFFFKDSHNIILSYCIQRFIVVLIDEFKSIIPTSGPS